MQIFRLKTFVVFIFRMNVCVFHVLGIQVYVRNSFASLTFNNGKVCVRMNVEKYFKYAFNRTEHGLWITVWVESTSWKPYSTLEGMQQAICTVRCAHVHPQKSERFAEKSGESSTLTRFAG